MAARNVVIAFGGNIGDPLATLSLARKELEQQLGICLGTSKVYRSAPMVLPGKDGSVLQPYLNAAACFSTSHSLPEVLAACRLVEAAHGRVRNEETRWESRTLDLDILLAGNETISTPTLTVPHPGLSSRDFVLLPLRDLDPTFVHPITGDSIEEMICALTSRFVESEVADCF